MNLVKGMRVKAITLVGKPLNYSLAGTQRKFACESLVTVGVVRHIRGDHPTEVDPSQIKVWIQPDDGQGEVCERCGVPEVVVPANTIVDAASEHVGVTVHVLDGDFPLCRFSEDLPGRWPSWNIWIRRDEYEATAEACRDDDHPLHAVMKYRICPGCEEVLAAQRA